MIDLVRVKLERHEVTNYVAERITSETQAMSLVRRYMNDYCSMNRENVVIMCLDIKHKVTAVHTLSTGTSNKALINPLEVFKVCLLSNSAGFIIAHNHPTGECEPSKEDIAVTLQLNEGCKIMGIQMLDHIIVGEDESFSMKYNELF